jgi:hypothetical protein
MSDSWPGKAPQATLPQKKICLVAYADATRQYLWPVELSAEATIGEAIAAARRQAEGLEDLPWDTAPVGIFGEQRRRGDIPADGDRIELYRPLREDPRQRRRAQSMRRPKAHD